MAKVLGFTIEIQGTKVAVDTTNQLREAMKKLQAEMGNVSDKELFDKMSKEASKLKAELKAVTDQQRNFVREIEAGKTGTGSYQQLNAELVKLRQNYKKLSEEERSSKVGQETIKNIQNLDKKLKDIDKSMGQFQRNVGNYPNTILSGIGSLAPSLSGITNTITDIGAAAGRTGKLIAGAFGVAGIILATSQSLFAANARIEETQADVRKTAGLTADEIVRLTESLRQLNTRTSLDDLLKIGAALGQLGVVVNSTTIAAVDKLSIALRGELASSAEDVANKVGILRNIFKDIQTGDVAADFLHIGNAINQLGVEGSSTADVMFEFVKQFGNSAITLGLTTGQVLGLSATMQELGVNAERGGTGIKRILSEMLKNPDTFSKTLNIPAREFNDLLNNDLFGALSLVLQKTKDLSGSKTDLSSILKTLKVDGEGEKEVFFALGGAMDLLNKRVNTGTQSLKELNSINKEVEIKNNTLAASWEKMSNAVQNSFITTAFSAVLKTAVSWIGRLFDGVQGIYNLVTTGNIKNETPVDLDSINKSIKLEEERIRLAKESNKLTGNGLGGDEPTKKEVKAAENLAAKRKELEKLLGAELGFNEAVLGIAKQYSDLLIQIEEDKYKKLELEAQRDYRNRQDALNAEIDEFSSKRIKAREDLSKFYGENSKQVIAFDKETKTLGAQLLANSANNEERSSELLSKRLIEIKQKFIDDSAKLQKQTDEISAKNYNDMLKAESDFYEKLSKEYNADLKAQKDASDAAEDLRQRRIDNAVSIINTIGSIASEIGNFIDQLNQQQLAAMDDQIAKQTDKLDSLQEKMGETTGAARVELARQIENEKAALAQSNAQKAEAEKKAARERQRIAIIQGVIDIASAIISNLENPFAAVAAGVIGAIQLATISAQAFAQGGKVLSGERVNSNSGARIKRSNGDNVLATVRTGEVVLNEQQQARLGGARTFKKIGVPGFATGGYTGDPLPRPSQDYLSGVTGGVASNNELRSLISAIDARFDRLQVHVVGEDVANELNAQSKAKKAAVI